MPLDYKPLVDATKITFSKCFYDDFVVMLRERRFVTLANMHTNAIEVEAYRSKLAKLKAKTEKTERKMKATEESTSSKNKSEDHKID